MKGFAVLVPEGIDIEGIVNINPSLFNEDYIKYLLSTVVTKQGLIIENKEIEYDVDNERKKITDSTKEYVSIESLFEGGNYNKHKLSCEYLIQDNQIANRSRSTFQKVSILERKKYQNGKNSYCYRLGWFFRKRRLKVLYITDIKMIRTIKKSQSRCDTELKRGKYEFLNKFFHEQNLRIDFEGAILKCEERYSNHNDYNKYVKELTQIVNIHNGVYRLIYKKDSIGRVYTNLTQLNKEYREFITYNNKTLTEVDLSNSIVFFLGLILSKSNIDNTINILSNSKYKSINNIIHGNNYSLLLMFSKFTETVSTKEIELVQKLCINGNFYESFVPNFEKKNSFNKMRFYYQKDNEDEYTGTEKQKKRISKKQLIAMLFAKPTRRKKIQKIFKIQFPELLEAINKFKNEVGYKKFSHLLFQIEAFFVLNIAARNFNKQYWRKAPIYTLHDCLITTSDYKNELECCFNENLSEMLGSAPNMESKNWE